MKIGEIWEEKLDRGHKVEIIDLYNNYNEVIKEMGKNLITEEEYKELIGCELKVYDIVIKCKDLNLNSAIGIFTREVFVGTYYRIDNEDRRDMGREN